MGAVVLRVVVVVMDGHLGLRIGVHITLLVLALSTLPTTHSRRLKLEAADRSNAKLTAEVRAFAAEQEKVAQTPALNPMFFLTTS